MIALNKKTTKKDLEKLLPFRDPFLFIDKVLFYNPDEKIITQKRITGKEWFLKGHFPGMPVVPGHIIAEAMVQAGSLFFGRFGEEVRGRIYYLGASRLRFFQMVKPRAVLKITAHPVKIFSMAGIVKAEVHVGRALIAKGEFTLAARR